MLKLNKQQMHQRPTYETLVRDTVLNPKDKINLPNRQATLLRLTQKLQMFDDESFIDIDEENKRIAAQRMQQVHLQEIVSEKLDTELKTEKILQNQETDTYFDIGTPRQSQDMQQPKHMASSSAQEPTTKHMQSSSSKEPSHLPPSTIEADLELATFYQDSIDKNEKQLKVKKKTIKDIVGKHLGRESGSINKPYVNTLVDLQNQTHVEPMDTSTDPNMDTTSSTVEKRVASPIIKPSKKAKPTNERIATPIIKPSKTATQTEQLRLTTPSPLKKSKSTTPTEQLRLTSPEPTKHSKTSTEQSPESTSSSQKKTVDKVKTTYTVPESTTKIPPKSRVNIQSAYEILADAVNKNVITGPDAKEINDLIKNTLKTDPKDKTTKKTAPYIIKKQVATARLKALYAKHYDALKKHHQSK